MRGLNRFFRSLAAGLLASGLVACAPKIILIDRDNFLEQEANGEWPDYEQQVKRSLMGFGPTPLDGDAESSSRRRMTTHQPPGELK